MGFSWLFGPRGVDLDRRDAPFLLFPFLCGSRVPISEEGKEEILSLPLSGHFTRFKPALTRRQRH